MVLLLVVGAWMLFALPALVAARRARRLEPRPGSLLAPTVALARNRLVVVLVALLAQSLLVMAVPRGDYIETGSVAVMGLVTVATAGACLLLLVSFVPNFVVALRVGRAVRRVRRDGVVGAAPGVGQPTIDFGVGQTCWLFPSHRATRYREPAVAAEWAYGTPPPIWAAFVGPALDLLYGIAFVAITGLDLMLTLR